MLPATTSASTQAPLRPAAVRCRVCDAGDLRCVLDYGLMPLAGGFVAPDAPAPDPAFPLRLLWCERCTLLQVEQAADPRLIFTTYSYASSTTRTLRTHFETLGRNLVERHRAEGRLVVEFGCNDGVLLRPLRQAGAEAVGVDPSDVAGHASAAHGWPLVNDYFTEAVARGIRARWGPAALVIGCNVFAHMDDIQEPLRAVTSLLDANGAFVFEVHYQGDLVALTQFDTVYHEHVCYHSLTSLQWLLGIHGLTIVDVERIPIHSGSIRVTAVKRTGNTTPTTRAQELLQLEQRFEPDTFAQKVKQRSRTLRIVLQDLRAAGKRIGAYGAAGRATVLLNYCGLGPELLDFVVDMSPLRYGRSVPGVRVPILPPHVLVDRPPDYLLLTAWNYEAEVVAKEQEFLQRGGRLIVPLPDVRIVGSC